MRHLTFFLCLGVISLVASIARAEETDREPITAPTPNRADEPIAETFSAKAATEFLDQTSLHWTKSRKCFTCHTNYAYLIARPAMEPPGPEHAEIRAALEDLVQKRWQEKGPRWDAEVVMSAAVLALNDAATIGTLHPATRTALDRMWTVQREDGGIDWLNCGWPPMESDDEFGACMMAIAAGSAPDEYRQTEAARAGLSRLRDYFATHPPPTLHHRAMLLWADSFLHDLLTEKQREATIQSLLELQKDDGGWNLATLGDWTRSDDKEQDIVTSDGYATGFVIYVLRRAGVPRQHPQLQKGIAWLKSHQRISGRWYTRSLNRDSKHFISHAGSAFAVLALAACEE